VVAARADLRGARVLELGCGLGIPSICAALGGARVLATDWSPEAVAVAARNAALNDVVVETAVRRWDEPASFEGVPWSLVLASDVLYERRNGELLLELLPRLGGEVLLADPGRPAAPLFLERAAVRWAIEAVPDAESPRVTVYRLRPYDR
jgi:predicted nicotinamide N-methyase